jgi:hypothetical protein
MGRQAITLTPLLRFQMRGAGDSHPQYEHGRRHGAPIVRDEQLNLEALDPVEYANIPVQHVARHVRR